jgi:hypothetical protein
VGSLTRLAARRDENEAAIVQALRKAGATVELLSATNIPDLLVGYRGQNFLLEVKTEKGKLKEGQKNWASHWRGQHAVVRTVDEALQVIGAL